MKRWRRILTVLSMATSAAIWSDVVIEPTAMAYPSPAIWVGSPIQGMWEAPGDWSTVPPNHHKLARVQPQSDWAVDLPTGAGQGV